VCAIAIAACSKNPATPASPSATSHISDSSANTDGTTLKVTAPIPQSPANNQRLETAGDIALTVTNGTSRFGATDVLRYRFQVHNANGENVINAGNIPAGNERTTYVIPSALEGDQTYSWRARVEMGSAFGPWSDTVYFFVPVNEGYMRGPELYDPLANGKTVGEIFGPTSWIPGKGIRLETQLSYVRYQLPQTVLEGEFSMLVTDLATNTEGDKTKLFAMSEGDADLTTNDRRMTVEKRGDPAGVIAWRLITHDDQVDTEGPAERLQVDFDPSQVYFWKATWRNNRFNLEIREGGVDGRTIYNKGKDFEGRAYDPNPHWAYLGAPVGRSGEAGASVDHVTIRQVWLSGRERPAFANK
jgi:hypothetical protein